MSDQQEKTEEATPFKLDDARKKGQVPHSQELVSFVMVMVFLVVFSAIAISVGGELKSQAQWWIANADFLAGQPLISPATATIKHVAYALFPLFGSLILAAILINLLFNGLVFSMTPLTPDFRRINPVTGLKKLFSRRMLVELLKLLVKMALFSLVIYKGGEALLPKLLETTALDPSRLPVAIAGFFLQVGFSLVAVMAISALFDMWYSRKDFARQMRMSQHELKQEYRRREGDPEIKSKRRRIQQELLKKVAALRKVKDADVIITNPTHVAVALQYRPNTMLAPVIVASGKGFLAMQICKLARRHRVPIIRRPPVARSLARCRLDSEIPVESQADIAKVYRWIISLPGNKVVSR
ncbi:MAG: EscU/YscU/HrcU family type III secretion system export apparatus switch protein [Fluviicoccus sp.]|uniref:EscU/YscU/HrcU family type III secretion system export apparatus switch protein n=1 Tax=Fluviicoccus sp. TaxID=2003552 RepID=UPI002722B5CD|nr:EscU/YscU/HrcU family type III secretion system export apparatus switch protein [Fluviicoccus sp.]MDO8330476.1 EscU/YscU/HrcU family type III secretion system export apparatus switch protein [Fluviicoccus sp.]